jgi:uncharacterized RDD family membrane protein YckC
MDEVTTNPASRWKRLGGAMIDTLISLIILVPVMFATGVLQQIYSGEGMNLVQQVAFFVAAWAAFLILNGYLLFNRGQTIGKVVMSTRIVDLSGNIPNFGKLLVLRYLALGIVTQIPIIGGLAGLANALFIFGKKRRCLHDYLAGTRVIDT